MIGPHIFVSHSHADGDVAAAIALCLEKAGFTIFIDMVDIAPGDRWAEEISRALDSCQAVVVVWTDNAAPSEEVRYEAAYAMGRHIPVVPLICGGSARLPSWMMSLQYMDCRPRWNCNAIRTAIGDALERRQVRAEAPSEAASWSTPRPPDAHVHGIQEHATGSGAMWRKAEACGLLDLGVGRSMWEIGPKTVLDAIRDVPDGGFIFSVGRSLIGWAIHHEELRQAIVTRRITCLLAMADPHDQALRSLAVGDLGEPDAKAAYWSFLSIQAAVRANETVHTGRFEVYGIPAYLPLAWTAYRSNEGSRCLIEFGIADGPNQRPFLRFAESREHNFYDGVLRVFERMLIGRQPILSAPERPDSFRFQTLTGTE